MKKLLNLCHGNVTLKMFVSLAVLAIIFASCGSNPPEQNIYSGSIIGTLGCYDAETNSIFYKGYFIETTEKEVFLSFNLDVRDSIIVQYGTYAIPAIAIPYSFSVRVLKPSDAEYIHYAIPIEDDMHQPITTPSSEIKQVIITPINE